MKYILLFVFAALLCPNVGGYLIVQGNHISSEGEQEYGLKQRLKTLEEMVAKLQGNKEHQINCSATIQSCLDGWLPYNGSCYFFGRENINFEKAKETCVSHNAYLVHIEMETEHEFLRSFIKSFSDSNDQVREKRSEKRGFNHSQNEKGKESLDNCPF